LEAPFSEGVAEALASIAQLNDDQIDAGRSHGAHVRLRHREKDATLGSLLVADSLSKSGLHPSIGEET